MLKRKIFYLSITSLLLISILSTAAEAIMVVDPALIKVTLTQKRISGTFNIRNTGDKEERYRAQAVHFMVGEKGGISVKPSDEYSLSKWIKFNPKEFVLPPKSSRMVRYSIIPEGKLKPREYWGAIQFMPLKGQNIQNKDNKGNTFNLEVMTVILVPIYGLVEGTAFSGELKQLDVSQDKEGIKINCTILNTSEGILRLYGAYQLIDSKGKVAKEIEIQRFVIFPKKNRIFSTVITDKLPSDKYKVRIDLKSTNAKVELTGENSLVYENK